MSPGPSSSVPASSKPAFPAGSGRWTIVALLFAASVINYFDRATISFALPLIAKDLALGPEQKGLILSAFFWSYALMQIPIGICADRWNMRWLYAGAFVLWSVAQGLAGFATTLAALVCFRVLLGIGEAIYLPGGAKIVSLLFRPSERGLPCGIFDFGTRTGLVLEALLVPWMLTHLGWQTTFQIIGFSALVWLFPWFWATPPQLRGDPPATGQVSFAALVGRALALARNRDLAGICIGFFLFDYFWYLLVTWLPDYLVTVRKMSLPKAGLSASLPFLVFGLSQVAGGWLADTLTRRGFNETRVRKWIITFAFLTGLLLIPAARAADNGTAVRFLMGACLVGLSTPNMLVILQHCAPPEQVGLWTGIFNFVGNLAGIVAPLVTGYIVKVTGSYTPAFVLAAVAIALGPLAFWLIVGPLPERRPPGE